MAKKRYHQSKSDRMHERRGMEHEVERKAERAFDAHILHNYGDYYAGMEPRRRQELEDAGMIKEDHRSIANLPQGIIMREYPKTGPYLPDGLDDTIHGVDRQMDFDDRQRRRNFYPKKV